MMKLAVLLFATLINIIVAAQPPAIVPIVTLNIIQFESAGCQGGQTTVSVSGACTKTGESTSKNVIPFSNSFRNCTYETDNCVGNGVCETINYGQCTDRIVGSVNITWLINAQQSETVKTDVAVAYKDFASNNCSDSSSSDFEFEANKCIVDGSASYAYNVISQAALSACAYNNMECIGQGTCQTIRNGECGNDAGPGGFILSWNYVPPTNKPTTNPTGTSASSSSPSSSSASGSTGDEDPATSSSSQIIASLFVALVAISCIVF